MKIIMLIILLFPYYGRTGYFKNEKKVLIKDCLEYFEKGKVLNTYVNRYFIREKVERSDEYYEISFDGKYYNLFFGYRVYDNKFKYIVNSECVTIDFDLENKRKITDEFEE